MRPLRHGARTAVAVVKRGAEDRVPDAAASITYWAMLSLAPIALAATALLGSLDAIFGPGTADQVRDEIIAFLDRTVGSTDATASFVATITDLLETPRAGIAVASLAAALWGVRRAFTSFFRELGLVARQPMLGRGLTGQVGAVLLGLATIAVAVLAALQFGAGPLFGVSTDVAPDAVAAILEVWRWLRFPVLGAVVVSWMAVVLTFGTPLRWRQGLAGALLATLLWLVAAVGFRFYVRFADDANAALGVLGGVIIALTWMFLQSLAALYGAELNAVLAEQRAARACEKAARPAPPASALATASGAALVGLAAVRSLARR